MAGERRGPKPAVVLGDNLDAAWISDTVLQIKIDVSKDFGESNSGKTFRIASTHGNQRIITPNNESLYIGLNVYRKKP